MCSWTAHPCWRSVRAVDVVCGHAPAVEPAARPGLWYTRAAALRVLGRLGNPGGLGLIMAHLEDALPLLEMALDDADRPLFDALVHPGTAVADFHNSNDWSSNRSHYV